MISVYINSTGYYIEGGDIEIARSFLPTVDKNGVPVMEPLQHLHIVLICALKELIGRTSEDDVVVYNDSRIIEEMSNVTDSFDEVCKELRIIVRRKLLPEIKSVVFFRKKAAQYISSKINHGCSTMLQPISNRCLMDMAEAVAIQCQEATQDKKTQLLNKFKQSAKPLWGKI